MSDMKADYLALPEPQQMRLRFLLAQRITATAGLTPVKGQPIGWESVAGMRVAAKEQSQASLTDEAMTFLRGAIDDSTGHQSLPAAGAPRPGSDLMPGPGDRTPSTIAAINKVEKRGWFARMFKAAPAHSEPATAAPVAPKLRAPERPTPYIPVVKETATVTRLSVRTELSKAAQPKKINTPTSQAAPIVADRAELGSIASKPERSSEIPTRIVAENGAQTSTSEAATLGDTTLRRPVRQKLRVLKWVGDPV